MTTSNNKKEPRSKGLGDTVEKILLRLGVSKDRVGAIMGIKECGCDNRKEFLNRIFPY